MKLAIEPKVFSDESLNSWLIRGSIANGSDPRSFYIALWEEYKAWNKDLDKHLPKQQAYSLAKMTALTPEEIKNLTLEPYLQKIINKPLNPLGLWYFLIPRGKRGLSQTNGMHFCSECLSDSTPYLKRQWRLAWNIGCPVHKIKLLNRCPNCKIIFSPQLLKYDTPKMYLCSSCGFDLRDSRTTPANGKALKFQEMLNNAIFNAQTTSFPALHTQSLQDLFMTIRSIIPFLLHTYKLKKYHLFFETLSLDISYMEENKIMNVFEKMSTDDREFLLKLIYQFLQSDLKIIKKLLQQLGTTNKAFLSKPASMSPTILYLSKYLKNTNGSKIENPKQYVIKPNTKDEVNRLYCELLELI
ncbi:MAG: TniQ family protein [Sulfurimonas sp.]|nr:TniQ family protein [Sulfurimonas sp.]